MGSDFSIPLKIADPGFIENPAAENLIRIGLYQYKDIGLKLFEHPDGKTRKKTSRCLYRAVRINDDIIVNLRNSTRSTGLEFF